MFRLPKDKDRQAWINVIPPLEGFKTDSDKFIICENHWPKSYALKAISGGTRPADIPSIFWDDKGNPLPTSVFKTPTTHRSTDFSNFEQRQIDYLKSKDEIKTFEDFKPEKELLKLYGENVVFSRTGSKLLCVFMNNDCSESLMTIVVENSKTLTSPCTLKAYKKGIRVPLKSSLHPNNGFKSRQMFFDAVNRALKFEFQCTSLLDKALDILSYRNIDICTCEFCEDLGKEKKLSFLIHQLQLLKKKNYTLQDYCFGLDAYPHCKYESLRDYLTLPSKRKLQSVVSSVDITSILRKTFEKVEREQQKNVFLMVDEVKIRPTISFSGGVLNGMAKNREECRATSMLCVMMKGLHRGPSVMVSVTPVHKLESTYQFSIVLDAVRMVEGAGGIVLGTITDNHKINQQYCTLFPGFNQLTGQAEHPLDSARVWYLLYDTVHLLKCIRNNWISEKTKQMALVENKTAFFQDIVRIYEAEKGNILKTTTLTRASVYPTKLQLQNVQHVLKVFNEKVVATLRINKRDDTADFVETVLNWWKTVNVSGRGLDMRFNDEHRAVQSVGSKSLDTYSELFTNANSGQGPTRIRCLTHDTKKALVQTMGGLKELCKDLIENKQFEYVLLREIQSDRLEGEFGVYRQSTGANAFMTSGDVSAACKKRLARYAAKLEELDVDAPPKTHECLGLEINIEDAGSMETANSESLDDSEQRSAAYVAGWLEKKCAGELTFSENDSILSCKATNFIEAVSRGGLSIPHSSTYELVCLGLNLLKAARHRACCRNRLTKMMTTMAGFYDIDITCPKLYKHLSNVLLHGLQKLDRDQDKDTVLLQTSLKKARMM